MLNIELIDPDWSTALVFDFDPDEIFIENQFNNDTDMYLNVQQYDLGFETYNPIINLGGVYLLLSITLIEIFAFISFGVGRRIIKGKNYDQEGGAKELIRRKCRVIFQSWFINHRSSLFFNNVIYLMQESLVQLSVSGLLYLNMP